MRWHRSAIRGISIAATKPIVWIKLLKLLWNVCKGRDSIGTLAYVEGASIREKEVAESVAQQGRR